MKKVLILVMILFLVSGCTNINDSTYEEIIEETTKSKLDIYNIYRKGYKFYLPAGLYIHTSKNNNEIITDGNNTFYLYIDLISYLNKNDYDFDQENAVYTKRLNNDDSQGYVTIKTYEKGKYLIEIIYNYAKIEVIVEKSLAKEALSKAMIILSSIEYNETFLKSISKESLLDYIEEEIDIFDKENGDTSNFVQYDKEYDSETDNVIPDYDLIK